MPFENIDDEDAWMQKVLPEGVQLTTFILMRGRENPNSSSSGQSSAS